jgi:hypothetical protein
MKDHEEFDYTQKWINRIIWFIIILCVLALFGCRTPSIELTYKAKCVATRNDTSQFEYYYNCHKLKPCAVQFEAIGEYEVGKYYWVKEIKK